LNTTNGVKGAFKRGLLLISFGLFSISLIYANTIPVQYVLTVQQLQDAVTGLASQEPAFASGCDFNLDNCGIYGIGLDPGSLPAGVTETGVINGLSSGTAPWGQANVLGVYPGIEDINEPGGNISFITTNPNTAGQTLL
jgi:hypothetical protein